MVKKNLLVKHNEQLVPYDQDDMNTILSLNEGDLVTFSTDDGRQLWRHKKYWLLLSKVREHMPEDFDSKYPTNEALHTEIKYQLGLWEKHITLGGKILHQPMRTNFMSMGEKRFKEYVNQSKDIILKYFLPGMDYETFTNDFMTLIFD